MIAVSAMTPASASRRIEAGVGDSTGLAAFDVPRREIQARRSAGTPLW
jgi:hypothetical protein